MSSDAERRAPSVGAAAERDRPSSVNASGRGSAPEPAAAPAEPNTQAPAEILARAFVANLVAAGVRDVVLCPGSRSAPLAYALADAARSRDLRLHVRVDERSAGFVALGLARVRGAAAVVTTSGTAVANLHPAVLEASHSGVGLIVVSADRPAELRGTGANQTTHQPGIFADAVRYSLDLPPDTPASAVRGQVARAVAAARGTLSRDPGPVHLNIQFREPLGPPDIRHSALDPSSVILREVAESREVTQSPGIPRSAPQRGGDPARVFTPSSPNSSWSAVAMRPPAGAKRIEVHAPSAPEPCLVAGGTRTVVVAGDGAGSRIAELAERAHWPLFAEPSSGARTPHAIRFYRDLLGSTLAQGIEHVIVAGHPTLSRPISRLLARTDIEITVVSEGPRWIDVAAAATRIVPAIDVYGEGDPTWLESWRDADEALAESARLTPHERVAEAIWRAGGALVLGSSSTIRAFDVVPARRSGTGTDAAEPDDCCDHYDAPARSTVVANRGLAGIDGTISTATGVALALGEPVRCVVGDLTFLHDATALVRGVHERDVDLQVIVLDDGGGSIFGTLEYGARPDAEFERIFATPQELDVAAVAQGFGAAVIECTEAELPEVLAQPVTGRSVIHVRLDRNDMAETLRRRRELSANLQHR